MSGYRILLRKEMLEQWRTMRLGVTVIVYLAVGLLSPATAKYLPQILTSMLPPEQLPLRLPTPEMADAVSQFLKNVGGTLTLAAVLLAMGMIASEKERGTAAFILTRPVGRGAFVAAKLTALAATLGLAMVAAGAAAYVYTTWLFEPPPALGFGVMVVLVWLSQLAVGAVTLWGSAVAPSAVAAGAIGFGAYVAQAVVSALPGVGPLMPAGLQNQSGGLVLGSGGPEVWSAVVVNGGIVLAMGGLAWLSLRRQEL